MQDFKVPTVQVATELYCLDGGVLKGYVYMAALSAFQAGPMLPSEWINSPPIFFPFRRENDETLLVNKHQVLAMSVQMPPPDEESWPPPSPVRRAVVEAGGKRFEGDVAIDMPENQRRLVDYLNRPEAFLSLVSDRSQILVRKELISRVFEIEETERWK